MSLTSAPARAIAPDASGPAPLVRPGQWLPLLLFTSLFFLWGLSYGLLDVLNKHFQDQLSVSKAQSGWLQFSYFGAYFVIAMPAAMFMDRYGYKRGILLGLSLFALGALLFVPATAMGRFEPFLLALFVIACGAGCLETAANPYVTVLGPRGSSEQRLNLSQSFNGLGSFIGPLIGGMFFFQQGADAAASNATSVQATYVAIAVGVGLLGLTVWRTALPEVRGDESADGTAAPAGALASATLPLRQQPHFIGGVVTQFFYVAAQVGIAALFINYATEHWAGLGAHQASYLLSIGLIAFTAGRFASTALMRRIAPARLLALYGAISLLLCGVVVANLGVVSVIALVAVFFFESIMFPTIFALGVKDLGAQTKRAASFQVMAIIGGALMPAAMGWVADHHSTAVAYALPAVCFAVVMWYGLRGHRVSSQ